MTSTNPQTPRIPALSILSTLADMVLNGEIVAPGHAVDCAAVTVRQLIDWDAAKGRAFLASAMILIDGANRP